MWLGVFSPSAPGIGSSSLSYTWAALTHFLPQRNLWGSGSLPSQPNPCSRTLQVDSAIAELRKGGGDLSSPEFPGGPLPWERRLVCAGLCGRPRLSTPVLSPTGALVPYPGEGRRKEGVGRPPGAADLPDGWSRENLSPGGHGRVCPGNTDEFSCPPEVL